MVIVIIELISSDLSTYNEIFNSSVTHKNNNEVIIIGQLNV